MKTAEITITNPTGLHTRPGTMFTKEAKKFESKISLEKEGVVVEAKSIVKLLKLGISQGDTIKISAEGSDEEQAISTLSDFLSNLKD